MNTFTAETDEYVPVTVTELIAGVSTVIVTAVSFAILPIGTRPTAWTAATILDSQTCAHVSGLTPGSYRIWVKVTASPETVVMVAGDFVVI